MSVKRYQEMKRAVCAVLYPGKRVCQVFLLCLRIQVCVLLSRQERWIISDVTRRLFNKLYSLTIYQFKTFS